MTMDERIRARDERIDLMFGEADLRGRERGRIEALEARVALMERVANWQPAVCVFCAQPAHSGAECVDDGPPESYAEPMLPRCGLCRELRAPGAYCATEGCPDSEECLEAEMEREQAES